MRKGAILTTQNVQLEQINQSAGSMIPCEEPVFLGADKVECAEEN